MGLLDFFKKGKPAPEQQKPTFSNTNSSIFAEKEYDTYTVKSGDSLSKIAGQFYGDVHQWNKIYDENRELIGSNPDMIQPGQTLKIPRKS